MSDEMGKGISTGGAGDSLTRLFAHAAPRRAPPESAEREIREALRAEWLAVTGRRLWVRRAAGLAIAAAVAAAVFGVALVVPPPTVPDAAVVASIQRVVGTVRLSPAERGDAGAAAAARSGTKLLAGQSVATLDGGLSLELERGGSLRLREGTIVVLRSTAEIELARGQVYFDSGGTTRRTGGLVVQTRFGVLHDVGTQFIARVERDTLDVDVREGAVAVERDAARIEARPGERLTMTEEGAVAREAIPPFGGDWDWVEKLAPPFAMDGRSVAEFLAWLERQTGRRVAYASPAAERLAATTILSGTIDLEPMSMLRAVLATTDLDFELSGDTILVSVR